MSNPTNDNLEREITVLKQQLADLQQQVSRVLGPFQRVFLAANGESAGTWHERAVVDNAIAEFTDGRRRTDTNDGNAIIEPGTAFALMEFQDWASGEPVTRFVKLGGGTLIPVALTQTGGADGTQSAAPTWTYTVKDITGTTTLLTGAGPEVRPGGAGSFTAATRGLAYYGQNGVRLLRAYETEVTITCGA